MPIYYLNLKRFILTCTYFEPKQLITELFDQLQKENHNENYEEYYCLFQKYVGRVWSTLSKSYQSLSERLCFAS
mgnify:CR=1 FL=1